MSSKKYKLLISDYDGTLSGPEFAIPDKTAHAIKKWMSTDHLFSIASGRQYLMLKKDCALLDLSTPIIVRGGAEIVNPKNDNIIFQEQIPKETVAEIFKILKKHTDKIAFEKDDTIFSSFKFAGDFPEVKRKSLDEFTITSLPKIVAKADHKKSGELEIVMDNIVKKFPELNIVRSYTPLGSGYDITSIKATKHLATLELIKLLGLFPEDVIGVGDGYNDFPLLEACGLKIAMENSPDELKAIADMVIPAQKEEGVAFLIEKLLREEG